MNCREWEERVAMLEDAPDVNRHLAECADCQAFAAGLRESLTLLREAHEDPLLPAHFTAVRNRVLAKLERQRVPAWRRIWVYGLTAVAASVLATQLWKRPEIPPPPTLVALAIPPAPLVERISLPEHHVHPKPHVRPKSSRDRKGAVAYSEPLVIKLITDNPDVVIYWIADKRGDY